MSCLKCGLTHQCVCSDLPDLSHVKTHFSLITHPNELNRETNTGKWLAQSLPNCQVFSWQRKEPNQEFLERCERYPPWLLFPAPQAESIENVVSRETNTPHHFVIVDATWQEAKKMLNRSDWLPEMPKVAFSKSVSSSFTLRRNQQEGNLCTLEVAAQVLAVQKQQVEGQQLLTFLNHFHKVYQADKSGHKYND